MLNWGVACVYSSEPERFKAQGGNVFYRKWKVLATKSRHQPVYPANLYFKRIFDIKRQSLLMLYIKKKKTDCGQTPPVLRMGKRRRLSAESAAPALNNISKHTARFLLSGMVVRIHVIHDRSSGRRQGDSDWRELEISTEASGYCGVVSGQSLMWPNHVGGMVLCWIKGSRRWSPVMHYFGCGASCASAPRRTQDGWLEICAPHCPPLGNPSARTRVGQIAAKAWRIQPNHHILMLCVFRLSE